MSKFYHFVENSCFLLDKVSNGKVKGFMGKSLLSSSGNETIPIWVSMYCDVHCFELNDFPIFVLRPKKIKRKKAILFLAGGGGMSRPTSLHYGTAIRLLKETGATIYMPFYPLAPKYNVRDALTWLEGLYEKMLQRYLPSHITFIGDSAGANLCLSLTERVKLRPSRLIIISPALGLEDGENREIRQSMEFDDPLLTVGMNDAIAKNWAKDVPLNSCDISPEYICLKGFPKILLFYGSHELFYPHVKKWIESMKSYDVDLSVVEQPMCHDWALCSFFSEGRQALQQMSQWINE